MEKKIFLNINNLLLLSGKKSCCEINLTLMQNIHCKSHSLLFNVKTKNEKVDCCEEEKMGERIIIYYAHYLLS
jgi:hypothetical protein